MIRRIIGRLARVNRLGIGASLAPPLPDAPSAPTAALNGFATADLSASLPGNATAIFFYGTSDLGDTYSSASTAGTINTGTLADGLWSFVAWSNNVTGNSANSTASTPTVRTLPTATTTIRVAVHPNRCFQGLANTASTAAAVGDPVGTLVDGVANLTWVAVANGNRPVLRSNGTAYYLEITVGQFLKANRSVSFANGPFTYALGMKPTGNGDGSNADQVFLGNNVSNAFAAGIKKPADGNATLFRQQVSAAPFLALTIANNTSAMITTWSAVGATLAGAAASATARLNGAGANVTANLSFAMSTANCGFGAIAAGNSFQGWWWGYTYDPVDQSGNATNLAAIEASVNNRRAA